MSRDRGESGTGAGRPLLAPHGVLRRLLVSALLVIGFGLCALVFVAAVGGSTGLGAGLLGLIFAALPLGIVVPSFLWIDRLEAEPRWLLLVALAWGALVATAVALVANTGTMAIIAGATGESPTSVGAVLVAPVVEETAKGLGLVLVLRLQRWELDGVVDGLVYAGIIAAGFAFGENILYLGRAFNEAGAEGLFATFLLRGVVGPFAHPIFTCCTGFGVGVATYRRPGVVRVLAPLLGWTLAVALHAAWNLSAVAGLDGFLAGYLSMQAPVFVAFVLLALWARRREARTVVTELGRYARAGWFTDAEVWMLGSVAARRQALAWASAAHGRPGKVAMTGFLDAASDLAMLRHRMQLGDVDDAVLAEERRLLDRVVRCRAELAPGPTR
ncbi:PrsW family intramembrane metalloprotease [Arsenicicoccus dermatophilus]|uniref:PrsW family intramembrane metalloprotease n=1 Tax=Arsenicicoccus dermatophilus TaxID=1076331 RepID=UPI001F4CCCEB|nr:PrsW family intramembrane metalloprotease [Arsenicicoccus dermatophilus]MCH8613493.1 PrsW family intramembrane metalloprotease [Arsenicicoccus dermatophilus]